MHEFYKKFSFPIRFEFIEDERLTIDWFKTHQDIIQEIYLPDIFTNTLSYDAHSFSLPKVTDKIINFLKEINNTNIKICVIYNDIFLSDQDENNTINNISNYLRNNPIIAIDTLVVPSKKFLKIKKEFPNILIKNTVILEPSFNEIKNGEWDDFDYIYVHDEIVHNLNKFISIKGTRKFGSVINFSNCRTDCSSKKRHYESYKFKKEEAQHLINTFCPTVSCSPLENVLKSNSIPTTYYDYKQYLNVLDIYKLQGRREDYTYINCIKIIENVFNKENILVLDETLSTLSKIDYIKWRKEIKNCSGICSGCSFCDDLIFKYNKGISF